VASLAGTWLALVMGFGGLRDLGSSLTINPRLPDTVTRLAFSIRHRGRVLHVEVTTHHATYQLTRGGGTIALTHHGECLTVGTEPITRPIPPAPERQQPLQPPGREPTHRAPG